MLTRLLVLLVLATSTAMAMTASVQVSEPETFLRTSPEGKTLAIANRGTRLTVLDQRGRWLRVRLSGWVRRPLPSAEAPATSTPVEEAEPIALPPVTLQEKRIAFLPQDYHRATTPHRAHALVTLTFANNSRERVTSVRYRLVLRDAASRSLIDKVYDSELVPDASGTGLEPVRHMWLQQGGPPGEDYRNLERAATKGGLTSEVTLLSAYFPESGELSLQAPDKSQ